MTEHDALGEPQSLDEAKEIIKNLRVYIGDLGSMLGSAHDEEIQYVYDGRYGGSHEKHAKHRPDCHKCAAIRAVRTWKL